MDEYVCVTARSRPGEGASGFHKRLIEFWSHVLRSRPDDYARVYAETTRFETAGDRVTRQYMIGADAVEVLVAEMIGAGIEHNPVEPDDLYSKYEATPPDWFQIPH